MADVYNREEILEEIWKNEFKESFLQKLESYIIDIYHGRASFNRLGANSELQEGFRKGGPLYVGASLIAQRGGSTVSETSLSSDEVGYQSLIQEDLIESWAKHKGFWVDNISLLLGELYGPVIGKGSESLVFKYGNMVFKEWRFGKYESIQLALDRVAIHNALFPATYMYIVAFGRTAQSDFSCIVMQPFVSFSKKDVTNDEVRRYMDSIGFDPIKPDVGSEVIDYVNDMFWVTDLHKENFVRDIQNNFKVIDAALYLNTPGIGLGGSFQIGPVEPWLYGDENSWQYRVISKPDNSTML